MRIHATRANPPALQIWCDEYGCLGTFNADVVDPDAARKLAEEAGWSYDQYTSVDFCPDHTARPAMPSPESVALL